MALTEAEYQALIVAELGGDATVSAQIATLWSETDDSATLREHYLRAKVKAIRLLMGTARLQVSFKALNGASVNLSDLFKHLRELLEATEAELAASATAAGGYESGEITKTAPVEQPDSAPFDANDRAFRGDPYRPPGPLRP